MVQAIIWSDLALKTYIQNIEFLKEEWTRKEVDNFIEAVERKLDLLKTQPLIGKLTNKRKHIRSTLIIGPVILVYRLAVKKQQIELVRFFNTRQNPKRSHI